MTQAEKQGLEIWAKVGSIVLYCFGLLGVVLIVHRLATGSEVAITSTADLIKTISETAVVTMGGKMLWGYKAK